MASLSEFFSDPASTGTWTVVADQSTVAVKSKSFWGMVPVKGRFTEFSGDGQVNCPPNGFRPHRHQGRVAAHGDRQARRAPALRRFL